MSDLTSFCEEKQKAFKRYLEKQLEQVKASNARQLSAAAAQAIEAAKKLLLDSNQKSYQRFEEGKKYVIEMQEQGYPTCLIEPFEISVKEDLTRSLDFSKKIFEDSVKYYKSVAER